jgi:hypothetical protein
MITMMRGRKISTRYPATLPSIMMISLMMSMCLRVHTLQANSIFQRDTNTLFVVTELTVSCRVQKLRLVSPRCHTTLHCWQVSLSMDVSPLVTPLDRPRIPSPNTPESRVAGVAMFVAGITGCYIPITAHPTTSGVVVTTKSIYAMANSLRLALLRHLACTEQLV